MGSLHLYQLSEMYARLLDEDDAAYQTALDQLAGDIAEKGCSVAAVRAELLAEAAAIKTEVDRLQARLRARQNRAESLREYLYQNMVAAKLTAVSDARFSLRIQPTNPSVDISDIDAVPDEFCRIERVADKEAILKLLKAGEKVNGAALVTGKSHLVIR